MRRHYSGSQIFFELIAAQQEEEKEFKRKKKHEKENRMNRGHQTPKSLLSYHFAILQMSVL